MYSEISISCPENLNEIVQSELVNAGFDGIWEDGNILKCYIKSENFNPKIFQQILLKYKLSKNYISNKVEPKNWNEEWEKSFEPVKINKECIIRASFHKPTNLKYEIVITPKMSFGTGHHSTTYLMAQSLFIIIPKGKKVLDMGSGTGILSILAEKLGAAKITAIDNEDFAIENSIENFKNNNCNRISVFKNESVFKGKFDLILSNITKNINLELLEKYSNSLYAGGNIVLSGFYKDDIKEFEILSKKLNLKIFKQRSKNNWACIFLKKC